MSPKTLSKLLPFGGQCLAVTNVDTDYFNQRRCHIMWLYNYLVLVLVLFTYLNSVCHGANANAFPRYQLEALHHLYNSTNGDHWTWKMNSSNVSRFDHDIHHAPLPFSIPAGFDPFWRDIIWDHTQRYNDGAVWNFTADANPCLDNWQGILCNGTGVCDVDHAWNCNITDIELVLYNLTGTIPPEITSITTLEAFDVSANHLYGTFPSGFGQLSKLKHISFGINSIEGSIPLDIFELSELRALILEINELTGTVPSQVGSLKSLSTLGLGYNSMFGTLPPTLGNLSNLRWIDLSKNSFSGSVPASIGGLEKLTGLDLFHNHLTGSFPSSSTSGANPIALLDFSQNKFSADMNWLITYPSLRTLYCHGNEITGTIPTAIGDILLDLAYLVIYENQLTGSLPTSLAGLEDLRDLYLYDNKLTGSIPSSFQFNRFRDVVIYANHFTGSLEPVIGYEGSFLQLDVGENAFTGSLPSRICSSSALINLRVNYNDLSGSTPSCIGSLTSLTMLDYGENYFTGTLPPGLVNLLNLTTLLVSANYLSGSLSSILPAASLSTVDLNDNGFTGELPYSVFTPSLKAFIAVKNCFRGPISSAVCSSTQLHTLDLSGLAAGNSCAAPLNLIFLKVYFTAAIAGPLPSCIAELSYLTQYYVAGNGIKSSMSDFTVSSSLVNMSLSNNRLTGTIPLVIQQAVDQFHVFDLSFNHLFGTIQHMNIYTGASTDIATSTSTGSESLSNGNSVFGTDTSSGQASSSSASSSDATSRTLELKSNRLTGVIPGPFTYSEMDINILEGNMFECRSVMELPHSDPVHSRYVCGSGILDPLWNAYGCFAFVIVLVTVYYLRYGTATAQLRTTLYTGVQFFVWRPSNRSGNAIMDQLANTLYTYRLLVCFVGGTIAFVFMPLFVLLKFANNHAYSTHTHQYGWIVSLVFMHHDTAAISISILWLLALCVFVIYEFQSTPEIAARLLLQAGRRDAAAGKRSSVLDHEARVVSSEEDTPPVRYSSSFSFSSFSYSDHYKRYAHIGVLLLFNTAVALTLNGLFVYITLSQPLIIIRWFTLVLVMFKLTWNFAVIIPRLDALDCKFVVLLSVMIFNNILAPVLATMAVDVSCFQELFSPPEPLTNPYSYQSCTARQAVLMDVTETCFAFSTQYNSVSFIPPFIYGGQCSSSIVQVYVPVFVVSYGLVGILVPLIQFGVMRYFAGFVSIPPGADTVAIESKCMLGGVGSTLLWKIKQNLSLLSKISNNILTGMVLPVESLEDLRGCRHFDEIYAKTVASDTAAADSHHHESIDSCSDRKNYNDIWSNGNQTRFAFYRSRNFALNNLLIFVLLVTFGLAYPPLAVMLIINVTVTSLVLQLCMHTHFTQLLSAATAAQTQQTQCRTTECVSLPSSGSTAADSGVSKEAAAVDETTATVSAPSTRKDTIDIHEQASAVADSTAVIDLDTDMVTVFAVWRGMLQAELGGFRDILLGSRSFIVFSSSAFLSLFIYDMTGTKKPHLAVALIVVLIIVPYVVRVLCRHAVVAYPEYFDRHYYQHQQDRQSGAGRIELIVRSDSPIPTAAVIDVNVDEEAVVDMDVDKDVDEKGISVSCVDVEVCAGSTAGNTAINPMHH